jgi:thiamine-phosphate pyrophosphorylase
MNLDAEQARNCLEKARLYLLITRSLCHLPPEEVLDRALEAGVELVQVREPDLADGDLLPWTVAVCERASARGVPVIVNNRPDIALLAGAAGVHVGQGDLPPEEVRRIIGPHLLLGLSTHGSEDVRRAGAAPIDYIGLGPVFDTGTRGLKGLGSDLLETSLPEAQQPVFCIGGLDASNLARARRWGLRRAAVSSAICAAETPEVEVAALRAVLGY